MKLIERQELLKTRVFDIEAVRLAPADAVGDGPSEGPYYRIVAPDWVNILPIRGDGHAVLIRQYRPGALAETLEIPGGMVDPGERDTMMAAVRELEEETGYTSQRVLPLGVINPNPAIMSNRVHFFLALAAMPNAQRRHFPDPGERITTELVPAIELDGLVRTGRIDHALAALCIMLAGKYIDVGSPERAR